MFHDNENTIELRARFARFLHTLTSCKIEIGICSYNLKFESRAMFRSHYRELLEEISYYETNQFFANPHHYELIHRGKIGCLTLINASP